MENKSFDRVRESVYTNISVNALIVNEFRRYVEIKMDINQSPS